MIIFPNAKINIGLKVINKREDGFHNLETIFYPVKIFDCIDMRENSYQDNVFSTSGFRIDGNVDNNLILKAHKIISTDYEIPSYNIHLHKHIPMGAGLGGGSADAAFIIAQLNKLHNLKISEEMMIHYASKLGSDCGFFIKNRACFGEGRGEILTDIDLDLSNFTIVIVNPKIHVSTKDAFSNLTPAKPEFNLKEINSLPIDLWKTKVDNDFEKNIFSIYPEIAMIKNQLYKHGAIYASMSGSGSTVYGIFKSVDEEAIKAQFPKSLVYFS